MPNVTQRPGVPPKGGKKKVKRKSVSVDKFDKPVGKPWFRKRMGLMSKDLGWGWIPISWQGWVLLLIFLGVNFASVFYFDLVIGAKDSVLKFLTVLVLSILVFVVIAMKKTRK